MGEIDFNLINIVVQTNFRLISYVPVKLMATTISKSRGYRYTKPYGTCNIGTTVLYRFQIL